MAFYRAKNTSVFSKTVQLYIKNNVQQRRTYQQTIETLVYSALNLSNFEFWFILKKSKGNDVTGFAFCVAYSTYNTYIKILLGKYTQTYINI
jgi:hypothetical protein